MPKSKTRKNHKQKVNSRNVAIQNQKSSMNNLTNRFLMDMIKKEQESGLFDNLKPMDDGNEN